MPSKKLNRKGVYLDLIEGDPFVHVFLEQLLEQLNNFGTFTTWPVIGTVVLSALCGYAIQAHARLYIPVLRANDAIQSKLMVALYPKRSPTKQETVEGHTQRPDVDCFRDGWTMRRWCLKGRRRIGVCRRKRARGGRLRYLRPKVKDDFWCEEGRRPSRLTKFGIVKKEL